jgi:small-conductance mechanosensitive channel
MNSELLEQLQAAQRELEPRAKALQGATAALRNAIKLAGDEKAEALAMQKVLAKLQQSAAQVDDAVMQEATASFESETQKALDALAYEFARDLKRAFEQRGEAVTGRPPTLVVDPLVLNIDVAARKAQWYYGREPLTRPLPLSISTILKAYDQQRKAIIERSTDVDGFLEELYAAWQGVIETKSRRPQGGRTNLVETYSKLVLDRQSARFWNAPSRSTFRDYERAHFVRDLVYAQESPVVTVDDKRYRLRLGVATKSQADSAARSVWVPNGPLDGEYYSDITFEDA